MTKNYDQNSPTQRVASDTLVIKKPKQGLGFSRRPEGRSQRTRVAEVTVLLAGS